MSCVSREIHTRHVVAPYVPTSVVAYTVIV